MKVSINIDNNEFPLLFKIKNEELDNIILDILKTGYKIHFSSENLIIHNTKYEMKNIDINDKLISLESNLNKLIGLSSNSYKKGTIGEYILEDIFKNRFGDIIYEYKGQTPHSGDAWLYLPDNKIIMLESKNYLSIVNKDEIIKLQNDMINHHIKWAIMISFNSLIQGMKELDLHTFIHNNETYSIIMIGNLSSDIHKLDLGLQIIRKLLLNLDNLHEFPWIIKDINQGLNDLNNIICKNYIIRDQYYTMEKDIQKLLSNYHIILRNYQYDIEKKANEIIKIIQGTMKISLNLSNIISHDNILEKYYNKKIYPILIRVLDLVKLKNWKLINDNNNDNFIIINNENIELGKIKILNKKIIINIIKYDISINLNIDKDIENIYILDIIKTMT